LGEERSGSLDQRPLFPDPSSRSPKRNTTAKQEPLQVPASLMARYDREELYQGVWTVPMRELAKQHGISDVALGKSCRKLFIPVPGRGYWAKKAANQPVESRPPLPTVQICPPKSNDNNRQSRAGLKTSSPPEASAEPTAYRESQLHCSCPEGSHTPTAHVASPKRLVTSRPELGTTQKPLSVSSSLMARYNRKDLYERVWTVPMRNLSKQYGVSDVALAKTCRKLSIPLPGRGYWAKKVANQPVGPRPPLPAIAIRTPKLTRREPPA
jgi:hypothetical protein